MIYSIIRELPLGHWDPLNDLTCKKIGTERSLHSFTQSLQIKKEFSIVSFERSASPRAIRALFAFFSFFFLLHTVTSFGGEKGFDLFLSRWSSVFKPHSSSLILVLKKVPVVLADALTSSLSSLSSSRVWSSGIRRNLPPVLAVQFPSDLTSPAFG